MPRRLLPFALLAVAAAAPAAQRKVQITSFERMRVEGPFQVAVITGRSPTATISGDPRRLERVDVRVDGRTLVIRTPAGLAREERGAESGPSAPIQIMLGTPTLTSATAIGGGALTIAGGRVPRLDLSVAGAGSIAFASAEVEQVNATVIGNGQITLAGRAARARLLINGAGRIDADGLEAGELIVRMDGPGEATARARFIADVTNTGLGRVTVAGAPKCTVKNVAGGPVECGAPAR
ncbi:MAG: hypothetical protein JWN21_2669 [Sphingomonas bacterium]|uniref:GIN domain-containing protein n=1 Tax=Sphingomonas bacterium TaxID=1895847 RepID=UPI0026384395|nr:DUF2807 domain-containing protein [Sphingomonas bacterium]MDB5697126.1 hypothetical protein [Sphingomonas bacterium]